MSESDLLKTACEDVETVRQMYFNRGTVIMELQEERDTLISVLKECVVALESSRHENLGHRVTNHWFIERDKAITHAKSTLSKYER